MGASFECKTLQEAIVYFSNPDNCLNYLAAKRWPNGVTWPICGSKDVTYLTNQKRWKCKGKHDRPQFSVKIGTVTEDSSIGLNKWLMAMWRIVNCKNGISLDEVKHAIGITQKSAWFLDHRIRFALGMGATNKFSGQIEAGETCIGGKARNMHNGVKAGKITGTGGKRGGKVRAKVGANTKKKTVQAEIRQHVLAGSALFTDALKFYEGLNEFQHEVVDHAVEYIRGEVHTNGLENFWPLFQRGLNGTYVSVEPFQLFRYLDEQEFRYNHRRMDEGDRFNIVARQIVGERLTWNQLTGRSLLESCRTH